MKFASWNVNSIKARQDIVLRWLEEKSPDVLMIQELKGIEFPAQEKFEALGYQVHANGQKTYNGVATLSKHPVNMIHEKLPGFKEDEQARYQEMEINGLRLINIYAPNGNPVETEKFPYKLKWSEHLYERAKMLREEGSAFLITGDFNIIPEAQDCHDPNAWEGDALYCPESRALFQKFLNLGLYDAFRIFNQSPEQYTFWDYQGGAFPKNNGIRIDHFLLSPVLADRVTTCEIDAAPRGWEKPSDHTPILISID